MRRSVLKTTPLTPTKQSRKKGWDDSVNDLSQYKLTTEEIQSRKAQRQSINSIFRLSMASPNKWDENHANNNMLHSNDSPTPKKIRRPLVHTRNPSANQTPLLEPPNMLEEDIEENRITEPDHEEDEQKDDSLFEHVDSNLQSNTTVTTTTDSSVTIPSSLDLLQQQQQLDNREFRLAQQVQKLEQEYEMMENLVSKLEQSQQVIQNNEKLELSVEENRQLREEFLRYKSEMNQKVDNMSKEMEMLYDTIAKLQIRISDIPKQTQQYSHNHNLLQQQSPPPQPTPPPKPTPQRITSEASTTTAIAHRLEVPQPKPSYEMSSEDEEDEALKIKEIEDLKNEYLNYKKKTTSQHLEPKMEQPTIVSQPRLFQIQTKDFREEQPQYITNSKQSSKAMLQQLTEKRPVNIVYTSATSTSTLPGSPTTAATNSNSLHLKHYL